MRRYWAQELSRCGLAVRLTSGVSTPPTTPPSGIDHSAIEESQSAATSPLVVVAPPKPATLIVGKIKRQPASSSGSTSSSTRHNEGDSSFQTADDGDAGMSIRSGGAALKIKRRAPWGAIQLRDSWSEDAMSKRDNENMGKRIHSEYRFHPHEAQRQYIKLIGLSMIPAMIVGMFCGYYYIAGKPLWQGDPQFILNIVRSGDCSPRSKFYPYREASADALPQHIELYRMTRFREIREKERQEAAAAEALQRAIHTVRV